MRVFSLKTCDTCRKAVKDLAKYNAEVIDIRADGMDLADISAIVAKFGQSALNTRSTTWRGLSETERAMDPVELIAAHPTVMKRPVIEHDGEWYQGWSKDVQAALL